MSRKKKKRQKTTSGNKPVQKTPEAYAEGALAEGKEQQETAAEDSILEEVVLPELPPLEKAPEESPAETEDRTEESAADIEECAEEPAEDAEENSKEAVAAEERSDEEASEDRAEKAEEPEEAVTLGWEDSGSQTDEKEGIIQRLQELLSVIGKKVTELWKTFRGWKLWQQVVAWVLVAVLAVGLAGYGYFHSKYRLMQISDGDFSSSEVSAEGDTQDELENDELQSRKDSGQLEDADAIEATGEVESDQSVFNILLIGTDDRTTEFSDNARGDTCILLSINRETNQIHLVSFERAIGVKIPYGEYEGQWDWLTHMFWYGGPRMMTQVIRDNFKIDVTRYIRVNIHTFMELVDSVGGVDIDMTEAECNNINHPEGTFTAGNIKGMHVEDTVQQDLVPGVNHLNGATAMCYARLRAIDDDWHRVERQRKVILAAVQNLKKLSITELDELLNNVLPLIQTNLTETDIASLLPEAGTFVNMDYDTITFPLKRTYGLMDGMCSRKVLALDFETNSQELQSFLYGETTADELTAKYESTDSSTYSYKNSESYQQNYEDAESLVGKSTYVQTTGKSKPSLVGSGSGSSSSSGSNAQTGADPATAAGGDAGIAEDAVSETGTEESAVQTAGAAASADSSVSDSAASDLGVVESTTTDPATGVVTITYYNAATGKRTAVAANTATGAATVTVSDSETGTTATAHVENGTVSTDVTAQDTTSAAAQTGAADAASAETNAAAGQ